MRKAERANHVLQILDQYIPSVEIPLHHKDAYTLLIATLLSAQCTDARVNSITPKLFALAMTPQQMAKLEVSTIEQIIRPCGLSSFKARSISNLSKLLVEKHEGKVPCDFKHLEALPGVGHKTASVVMQQAFHMPAFPVDTHIFRCAKRWGLSKGKNVKQVEEDLKKLFPKELWGKIHLQIILFARKYCPARGHHMEDCPMCRSIAPK